MKRKKISRLVALGAALSLFTATALASSQTNNGYEVMKESLQSIKVMNNGTMTMNMEIIDNGESIADFEGVQKMDYENMNMSGTFNSTFNDTTKSVSMFRDESSNIIVDQVNDLYYQMETPENFHEGRGRHGKELSSMDETLKDRTLTTEQEALIDYLVGDLKDNFSVSTLENGQKTLSFNATENDIPVLANLLISAASSNDSHETNVDEHPMELKEIPLFEGMEEAKNAIPELKEDIKIIDVQFDMTLNSNDQLIANTFLVQVEGKDAEGMNHEVIVKGLMEITNIDETVVDTIDVSDKEVRVLEFEGMSKSK